jgi:DNA-binding MurR/RpiR family transcriptional regulator
MVRYKEIKSIINSKYNSLTRSQRIIADYVVDNFDSIPLKSVSQIAEATSSSVASVVRFSQKIGYKGFLHLRDDISNTLESRLKKKEIFSLIDDSQKSKEDILTLIADQDILNINQTSQHIDRTNFNNAIDLILNSDRVFTLGLGISYLLAEILAYQLNQVAINANNFGHSHSSFMEQILYTSKNDLLLAFSFPPYSKETISALEFAKEKKIKIVGITNKASAPISRYCDVQLNVISKNMLFTNSFSAVSVIINAIATQCALSNKSKAEKMLSELNKIVEEQKLVLN